MAEFGRRKEDKVPGAHKSGPAAGPAEEMFKKATALHQEGDINGALVLYSQIVERFKGGPRAELAKTLIAGIHKEKISVLWNAAADARGDAEPDEALRLYALIGEDYPASPEAASAKNEIAATTQIAEWWREGLDSQSGGNEAAARDLYHRIAERYPDSPEAANARLLISIIDQNRLIPTREVTQDLDEHLSPEQIVANLLTHKKAGIAPKSTAPDAAGNDAEIKRIDKLWEQAVTIERDGHRDEAVVLFKRIIETAPNGYKVRDAKYRLEKLKTMASYDSPEKWGLTATAAAAAEPRVKQWHLIAAAAAIILTGIVAAVSFLYKPAKPASWTDAVDNAKKSVVVVKTATGAGTGFLFSSDGVVISTASIVGKEKDVEIRLYSGALKRAAVVKVGTVPLDIAVLKIDNADAQFLPMGPAECREGAEIRAIGAPQGIEYFVTKGIVSHCSIDRDGVRYLQTDTPMAPGNGGGPCIDKGGKVIGLSTSLKLGDNPTLNLVLPITVVKDFMDGKLVALEDALMKKEEEKAKELEQNKNKFYTDAETTYKRLQEAADEELRTYLAKLDNLVRTRAITYDQAKSMAEQVRYSPFGSAPLSEWVHGLSFRVMKGEISENDALTLIREHFKR